MAVFADLELIGQSQLALLSSSHAPLWGPISDWSYQERSRQRGGFHPPLALRRVVIIRALVSSCRRCPTASTAKRMEKE